ncbi:hypothetical protein ACQQ2N_11190 [Dokdonella sp. MW10]|uniref:hypothetical protein n=1 Tax=Dokdonella sp. MW10 TaxID=2992926 RepID=UPI003F7FA0C4
MTLDAARIGNDSAVSGAYWQGDVANTQALAATNTGPQGLPVGDGNFSAEAAGTQPQPERDLQLAQMANDSYSLQNAEGVTGTQSEAELAAAGWTRLEPAGDHLVDANGNRIEIDPKMLEDSTSGFRASIYQNAEGQYVVAFAGTNPSEMGDLIADGAQAFGLENTQYNMAINLAKKAEVAFGEGNVVYTGHSLGGGLASTAALAVGSTAVTFNSAGPSNDTLRGLGFNPNEARSDLAESGQIRHYIVDGDPLNLAQSDIPAIPAPYIGAFSPPDAVGHELRIALPDGMRPVIDSHGGSGDGTSYVEALRQNTPYAGAADNGFAIDALGRYGDFTFNTIGSAIEAGVETVKDVSNVVQDTAAEIRDVWNSDASVIEKGTQIAGDVIDGVVDSAGVIAGNAIDGAGDIVQDATDFAGGLVRDAGKATGLQGPADAVARVIEGGGELVNKGVDAIGGGVEWAVDKVGDGLEVVADVAGKVGQGVVDGAVAAGRAVVDGAVIAGNAIVDGAKVVGNAVVDGATAAGNAVVDGAKAVGGAVSDAASWVGDKLKFW